MRTLQRNKQEMKYALLTGQAPIYVYDDDGNKIVDYVDEEGNEYYRETGEYEYEYSEPISFFSNISSKLVEAMWNSFGIDNSHYYAQLICEKGYIPLAEGAVIWKKSDPKYKNKEQTITDGASADYTVVGVADDNLNFDYYLLKKNN